MGRLLSNTLCWPLLMVLVGSFGPAEAKRRTSEQEIPTPAPQDAAADEIAEMNYGKSHWGMSQQEFLEVYPASLQLTPGQWALGMRVGGHDAVRTFRFVGDQLVNVNIVFADTHTDPGGFVADYREIHDQLVTLYDPPAEERQVWSDEMFRDTPEQWGAALINDHVRFWAQWSVPGMNVRHFLEAQGVDLVHGIIYVSTRLWELYEQTYGADVQPTMP